MSDYWERWRESRRQEQVANIAPVAEAQLMGAKLAGLTSADFAKYRREQNMNRKALGLPPLPRTKKGGR